MNQKSWSKVTEGLYGGAATAVNITSKGTYLLEANGSGIYRKEKTGPWTLVKKTNARHRQLYVHSHSSLILSCGDRGSVLVSFNDGISWFARNQGIPPATLWNIIAINENEWLTHTSHHLYYTSNQGQIWKRINPFGGVEGRKPDIRTIYLTQNGTWLIGTKVHPTLGGLWAYLDGDWVHVKRERFAMISSISEFNQHLLIATGACRSSGANRGTVKAINLSLFSLSQENEEHWDLIDNPIPQRGYLDIHVRANHVYVAAYGDGSEEARGGVFEVIWPEKKMQPLDQNKGQVWRIAGNGLEWFSAGAKSVECSMRDPEWFHGFQNLSISDLTLHEGSLWISTSNEGILRTSDDQHWIKQNEGLPEEACLFHFKTIKNQFYMETSKGIYVRDEEHWIPCLAESSYARIYDFEGKPTICNLEGLWVKSNHDWSIVDPFSASTAFHQLFDAICNDKEWLIATDKGLYQYSKTGGLEKLQ